MDNLFWPHILEGMIVLILFIGVIMLMMILVLFGLKIFKKKESAINIVDSRYYTTSERLDWAEYFEHWGSHVGDPPFTQKAVVAALRGNKPFGVADGKS